MTRITVGAFRIGLMLLCLGRLAGPAHAETNIFLVRHAERDDHTSQDPELNADGAERARVLRDMLRSLDISGVYSTDTKRTKNTAMPTALGHKLDVMIYDYKEMAAFASLLVTRHKDQNVLVTGHTNTVPALIKALGIEKEVDVADSEFDNLFLISLEEGRKPRMLHLHYGY